MDLMNLEEQAKTSALKHVSIMLQRADQLEKLDQYKKRTNRKKAAVEAMLKTAVQRQLEGVKNGLAQLSGASEDIQTISENLVEIDEFLDGFVQLKQKLTKLKEENRKHSQYAAAMENLKQIFNVPETIEKTHELISDGKFLQAHKNLMELETARDDLMFEVHKLQSQSEYDKNLLKTYFSEVEKVAQEFAKQIWYIVGRTLEASRGADPGPQQVVTALRIIEREERIDAFCRNQHKATGFMPVDRPRNWKKKCFETLEKNVLQRIEGNQLEDRSINKQWLARYLETTRIVVLQDLRSVKGSVGPCYPPSYNIYDRYVTMYHRCLSQRVKEITNDDLEKNELFQLLTWLKTYSGEEMLGHPVLRIDVQRLLADFPLLPKSTISQLSNRFVEMMQNDLHEWLEKTLSQEKDDWYRDAEPEQDTLGYHYSALPAILFQMVDDQVKLAKEITMEIVPKVLLITTEELLLFTQRYKDAFQAYKIKHFEDRSRFRHFTHTLTAVCNNCGIFLESTDKLKKHVRLTVEAEMQSPRGSAQRQELLQKIDKLKERWTLNCQSAVACLLDEVFQDMNPHLSEILTKKWIPGGGGFDTVCATVDDYYNDHKHLKPHILSQLLMEIQYRILQEYMRAIENRRMTFGNYEEREGGGKRLEANGQDLKSLFTRLVPDDEEGVSSFELMTEVLPAMAQLLFLREKSLLPLELSGLVRAYPDISTEQLAGLLQMREDVGRSEARQLAQEILDQQKYRPSQETPFTRLFRPRPTDLPPTHSVNKGLQATQDFMMTKIASVATMSPGPGSNSPSLQSKSGAQNAASAKSNNPFDDTPPNPFDE